MDKKTQKQLLIISGLLELSFREVGQVKKNFNTNEIKHFNELVKRFDAEMISDEEGEALFFEVITEEIRKALELDAKEVLQ